MGSGTRRQKAKEETGRIILDAAYSLFAEKGFEKATMRELAGRAGVGLGTVFQHFSDKPSLLIAAIQEDLGAAWGESLLSMPEEDLKAQLIHLVRHVFAFYAHNPSLSRELVQQILFLQGGPARTFIDDLERFLLDGLATLYRQAAARGEISSQVDIGDAVAVFWACYASMLLEGLRESVFPVEEQLMRLERMIDQHLNGIRPAGYGRQEES